MPNFSSSNLANALTLPLKSATTSASQSIVADTTSSVLSAYTQKKKVNYEQASNATKQAEVVAKLQADGNVEQFDSLTRRLDIIKTQSAAVLTDSSTNKAIANISSKEQSNSNLLYDDSSSENKTQELKVKISQEPALGNLNFIIFDVMPTISESHQATYDSLQLLHHPGDILKYKSTSSRSWTITAKFASRTVEEATNHLEKINLIRSWVMPFYGEGTANDPLTKKYLGAPPPILTLQAYGPGIIGPVKCVLESFDWRWPDDVDYIPTYSNQPFPVLIDLTLNLKETFSPAEYSGFDLMSYRNGDMEAAFRAQSAAPAVTPAAQIAAPESVSVSEPVAVNKPVQSATIPEEVSQAIKYNELGDVISSFDF